MTEIVLNASQIMIDPALQVRPVEQAWNRRLEEAAQQGHDLRPLLVAKMGEHYILIGGAHRLEVWKRHLKTDDPRVRCMVVPWTDFKDMRGRAIRDNMHGKPYTEHQLTAMFFQLTTSEGWTREEAMKTLGLADARVDRIIEDKKRESEPSCTSQPGGMSEPRTSSQPEKESEPLHESQPPRRSEPTCESQPSLLSEPVMMNQPEVQSEPPRASHPTTPSVFPSPDDNAVLSHISGLCRRQGYKANQFTQQPLAGLKIWMEEALS